MHVLEQGLKNVFVPGYVSVDQKGGMDNIHVSIEYPSDKLDYPAVWVDFEPTGEMSRGGIDDVDMFIRNDDNTYTPLYLWRAEGWATYTIATLSSLERARVHDEVTRVFAFGRDPQVSAFRAFVEQNDFLAMNMDFDRISERGTSANPGTPWGTEEVIYETTLAMQCVIEFLSTGSQEKLYPVSAINVYANDGTGNYKDVSISQVNGKIVNSYGTTAPPMIHGRGDTFLFPMPPAYTVAL